MKIASLFNSNLLEQKKKTKNAKNWLDWKNVNWHKCKTPVFPDLGNTTCNGLNDFKAFLQK